MFLLAISVIIQFANVLCHTPLDFATVASRTCPHESDMEQRLSMMMEIIGWKSSENEFFFQQSGQSFDLWIQNIFGDEATIVFPFTIDSPAPYFTRPEFVLDMIDFSEHGSWYNLDAILNGGEQSDIPPEFFSDPSPIPFGTFLETLPFTVDISVGTSWYWCDEENAWGFGKGTVFIREKATAKTYILRAQIVTTFKKTVNFARNDEWVLNELGVMWDVYSETTSGSALNAIHNYEHMHENIKSLYDGVLNKAGGASYAVDSWLNDHFNSNSLMYCVGKRCVEDKNEIKEIIKEKYFGNSNLISYNCDYENAKNIYDNSITINCDFTFKYTDKDGAECQRVESSEMNINYCTSGTITEYIEITHNEPVWSCKGIPEYIDPNQDYTCHIKPKDSNYLLSNTCYNTGKKNPCCATQRASKIYYFPSCSGCCNFIQCDDFGQAFDRPCAPGTGWDQSKLTCTTQGQCSVIPTTTTTTKPPTGYTPKPTTTTTKSPTPAYTPKPTTTTTKSPTPGYTPKPTTTTTEWPTAKPTPRPTTTTTTKSPSKWPTARPTTNQPSAEPTQAPTTTKTPTRWPTARPTTSKPTPKPTLKPSGWPTPAPTDIPTRQPTKRPTTTTTTGKPTDAPSVWTKSPTTTAKPTPAYVRTPKPTTTTAKPTPAYVRTPKPTTTTAKPTPAYSRTPKPANGYGKK